MTAAKKNPSKKGPREKSAPREVSVLVLADFLGLTEQRLGQLVKEGMPKSKRGSWPLRDAVRWYVEYQRKNQAAVVRSGPTRADLDRDLVMLKLKKAQGEVFDRREVLDVMASGAARLGNELEALATRIGRELNLPGEDVKIVRDMVDEARTKYVRDCGEFIEVTELVENEREGQAA